MVYFRCYLVNLHVQAVQNMCDKGGLRAELRAADVCPIFEENNSKRPVDALAVKTSITHLLTT